MIDQYRKSSNIRKGIALFILAAVVWLIPLLILWCFESSARELYYGNIDTFIENTLQATSWTILTLGLGLLFISITLYADFD